MPQNIAIGSVVLVRFPFADGVGAKTRPALVMSAPDRHGDRVLVPISSSPAAADGIPIDSPDLQSGSLRTASWIKPTKPQFVQDSVVEKVLGVVKPHVLQAVRAALCPALGCAGSASPC